MQFNNPSTTFGYSTPEEMKKVWGIQLDLAKKLKEVCERNGLQYWMDGGTLLGAVRHQGFIPWDDDIDFAMPRKDYDKLNKIAAKEFTHPYFWQTTYSEEHFYCGHAQLRNAETSAFGRNEIDKDYCLGIGIDIFVLDGVPDNKLTYALCRLTSKGLSGITRWLIKHPIQRLSHKCVFKLYEALFRTTDADYAKCIGDISWRFRHHEIFLREHYTETKMLDFADTQFPAPYLYKEWLSRYFGEDYMTPKQVATHHGLKYINAEMPFRESITMLKNHPELFEMQISKLYNQ